jgi:hypothetical protein
MEAIPLYSLALTWLYSLLAAQPDPDPHTHTQTHTHTTHTHTHTQIRTHATSAPLPY